MVTAKRKVFTETIQYSISVYKYCNKVEVACCENHIAQPKKRPRKYDMFHCTVFFCKEKPKRQKHRKCSQNRKKANDLLPKKHFKRNRTLRSYTLFFPLLQYKPSYKNKYFGKNKEYIFSVSAWCFFIYVYITKTGLRKLSTPPSAPSPGQGDDIISDCFVKSQMNCTGYVWKYFLWFNIFK